MAKKKAQYIAIIEVVTQRGTHYDKLLYLYDIHTYNEALSKAINICDNHNNDFSPTWNLQDVYALCGGTAR